MPDAATQWAWIAGLAAACAVMAAATAALLRGHAAFRRRVPYRVVAGVLLAIALGVAFALTMQLASSITERIVLVVTGDLFVCHLTGAIEPAAIATAGAAAWAAHRARGGRSVRA